MEFKDASVKSELDLYIDEITKLAQNLDDLFNKIGFDQETKLNHIHKFFQDSLVFSIEMCKTAENYQDEIKSKIKLYQQNIMSLSLELGNQCDGHFASEQSMLNQEKFLQDYLANLQNEKQYRLDEFSVLLSKEESLCSQLSVHKTNFQQSIPSRADIEGLKARINELEALKIQRLNQMAHYRLEIMEYSNGLETFICNDSFLKLMTLETIDNLPLSLEALEKANFLCKELKIKSEQLNEEIRQLKVKIKQIWLCLNIQNQDLIGLIENNNATKLTINKDQMLTLLKEELERCMRLKTENLGKLIEHRRLQIRDLYQKMFYSESMCQDFEEFINSKNFTDELIKIHENKLEELQFKYTENQMLVELISKWLNLWHNFVEFDTKTKDPNRFKARGYNGAEENKQRKQYQQQFPKLEDELRKYAEEYKKRNGDEIFKVYGVDWNIYIENLRKANEKPSKENEKKEQNKGILKENVLNNSTKQRAPSLTKSASKRKNDDTINNRVLSASKTATTKSTTTTTTTAFSHQANTLRRSLRYNIASNTHESKSLPLNSTTSNTISLTDSKKLNLTETKKDFEFIFIEN